MRSDGSDFFHVMRPRVDALWRDSHVRSVNGRWGYHLSALPFVVGKNAIVGLNWGAKNPAHYGPQTTEPAYKDSEIRQWDFIGDYLPLIRRYLGEVTRGDELLQSLPITFVRHG